jgi:ribosomal protein L24
MLDELEVLLGALRGQQGRLLELSPDDVMVGAVDVAAEPR